MLKQLAKRLIYSLLGKKSSSHHRVYYSSSSHYKHRPHVKVQYGHKHYKRKHKSFSSYFSS